MLGKKKGFKSINFLFKNQKMSKIKPSKQKKGNNKEQKSVKLKPKTTV